MRLRGEHLLALMAAPLFFVAVLQPDASGLAVVGVAAVLLALSLGSRYLAVLITSRLLMVGHRSRAHREALSRVPAPLHPNTDGRPRPRAPGRIPTTA
ncbi:DUF6412 domain-containing protein [Planctomonas psychrotolerans]|uniref:DUF6412 domain-containing protein n=1 Tax=Planctomonas psychrotolerans TaxID=2528712 RepID=UPI001238A754|nr:DUF6412 domain-containing protein [Planctomonas psychrotolerans]